MTKCNKCHKTLPCGCDDQPLFTPTGFVPDSTNSQACGEYVFTGCIIYNGPALVDINIEPGMNLNQIIQALVLSDINPSCITTTCYSPLLFVKAIGQTTIDIAWALVPEAVTYTVSYSDPSASPVSWTDTDVDSSTTHLLITGLECGTSYEIKVTGNFLSSSCDSLTILVTTLDC